ncbi:cytochrome P450 [Schizopora paradoxa]|uniref:Cytochrome P450 n=1 Tax=Schizopora paradoxa TaxID=27342 RepID=A0A0H2S859_9AGAM|nr:cytochrome P450 [Schizopora paradoxa]
MNILSKEMVLQVLVWALQAIGVVVFAEALRGIWWLVNMLFVQPPSDPLRHLPGPDAPKMRNHFRETMDPMQTPETHDRWRELYGKTFRFHGFGSFDYRLLSFDHRVISYVLNSPTFEKPWQTRRILSNLLGRGIIATEGDEHAFLRKLISPAFNTHFIKSLTPLMFAKAEELKYKWDNIVSSSSPQSPEKLDEKTESATIDVASWLSRTSFDIIGLTAFDYSFDALNDETDEVYNAYKTMLDAQAKGPGFKRILELFFPILETLLPDQHLRNLKRSQKVVRATGLRLVSEKRAAILADMSAKNGQQKDLLSLLIRANLSENHNQRLSDDEIVNQLSTFLFAGAESTAISAAWALHHLSLDTSIQDQLREELLSSNALSQQDPTAAIDALPYLDAVVRETLRFVPPAHGTIRVATQDEVIPLSEPIVLRTNELVNEVHIKKGSYVHIAIEGLNYCKDIWGDDAREYKPSRWLNLPPSARGQPGLANLMSFSYGPQSCIGWRFSLIELKIFLATLVTQFSFEPAAEIGKYNAVITRPYVRHKFDLGPALPLKVSRLAS